MYKSKFKKIEFEDKKVNNNFRFVYNIYQFQKGKIEYQHTCESTVS